MANGEQVNVRELIRAHRPTRKVTEVTSDEGGERQDASKKTDSRFVNPELRTPIKEDSGTYSVVFKKE